MSKIAELLNLSEGKTNVEEGIMNPVDIQQTRCNFGVGYGADLRERTETVSKFFPSIQNANNMYSLLGRSGVKLSKICLGTLNFGEIDAKNGSRPGQLNKKQCHQILNRFVELGGNCIDTANFYPWFGSSEDQHSESIIGSWLKNVDRNKMFIITKVGLSNTDGIKINDINSFGVSRMNLFNSVESSLKRLQTTYIDMLQLQAWDPTCNVYEVVKCLDELVKSGKVRYFGVIGFKGYQLQKILDAARMLGTQRVVCYDGEYNILTRGCETEVAEVCRTEKIGFLAHSPLKYGLLCDKYQVKDSRSEAATKDNLAAMSKPFDQLSENPIYDCTLNCLRDIAQRSNLTVSQIAIMWALQKNFVTSAILGVSSIQELDEAFHILNNGLRLSPEDMLRLNNISRMELSYPNQVSLISIYDSNNMEDSFQSTFKNISLLPVYLSQGIVGESNRMRAIKEHEYQSIDSARKQELEQQQQDLKRRANA